MRRHHRGPAVGAINEDESSSDEDAFSSFSRKKRRLSKDIKKSATKKGKEIETTVTTASTSDSASTSTTVANQKKDADANTNSNNTANSTANITAGNANTSSNKRHHHHSSERAARMDSLLEELTEKSKSAPTNYYASITENRPPPDKMGSYVMPGEEQSTTNIFVGNLSPLTTEEQLTELFRHFGESVSFGRLFCVGVSLCFSTSLFIYLFV